MGATGDGDLLLTLGLTEDGPASTSESLSESEESKSDDDEPGAVGSKFGFQSACLDFFLLFVAAFDGTVAAWSTATVSSTISSLAFPFPLPLTSSSLLLSPESPCLFLNRSIPFRTTRSSRPSFLSWADVGASGVWPSVAVDSSDSEVPVLGASEASSWIFLSLCSSCNFFDYSLALPAESRHELTIYDSSLFLFFVPMPDCRLISLAKAMDAAVDGSSFSTKTSSPSLGACDPRFLFL